MRMAQSRFYRNKDFSNPKLFYRHGVPIQRYDSGPPQGAVHMSFAPYAPTHHEAAVHAEQLLQQQALQEQAVVVQQPAERQETSCDLVAGAINPYPHKHPLHNTWTMWYLENDRSKVWEDMQNVITSFDTVEDFWSLYNHIKLPSGIKLGSDYSMFKEGVRPMWEDVANKFGGRWVITLNKNSKADLDSLWLDVLLCLIGEAFDNSEEICGAVVNIRGKFNKISVWTANGNNKEAVMEIGKKLHDTLRLGNQNLQYQLHADTMVKTGANAKSIYTL